VESDRPASVQLPLNIEEFAGLTNRIVPILGFVLCITVVAELADRIGVFAVLADRAAALARGSVLRLWLLLVVGESCNAVMGEPMSGSWSAHPLVPLCAPRPTRRAGRVVRLGCALTLIHRCTGGVRADIGL
jgi:hypothetical protein